MGVGWGGVGWDGNVHVPCVHTWILRCCYVTDHGLGGVGWDGNVHVPCVHTWILRCCYVTDHGLGGVGWDGNVHVPCVPLVLCNVCNRRTNVGTKASWWQTVPHATLNWPLNTGCFMKLAIIVRASSASSRKRNGETCWFTPVASMECGRFPKVRYHPLGTHVKMVLSTLNCLKE